MRATINGVRYDTRAAVFIGMAWDRKSPFDTAAWHEELYRTQRSGRWFLYGEGEEDSFYGRLLKDGSRVPGKRIIPLTPMAASRWAEQHLPAEVVDQHFGGKIADA